MLMKIALAGFAAVAWPAAEAGDVAALYLFNERAAGESAVGVPISNAVDAATHAGSADVVDGEAIVYDDMPTSICSGRFKGLRCI